MRKEAFCRPLSRFLRNAVQKPTGALLMCVGLGRRPGGIASPRSVIRGATGVSGMMARLDRFDAV